jgi:hypothetical protein
MLGSSQNVLHGKKLLPSVSNPSHAKLAASRLYETYKRLAANDALLHVIRNHWKLRFMKFLPIKTLSHHTVRNPG